MNNLLSPQKVWFFDLDDTLISTMDVHKKACEGVYLTAVNYYQENIARQASDLFCHYFALLFDAYHLKNEDDWKNPNFNKQEYEELLTRMKLAQKNVLAKFHFIKKWSREVLIKLALEKTLTDFKIPTNQELNKEIVYKSAEKYWNLTVEYMHVFDDAKKLLEKIKEVGEHIFIMTSSDGRLLMDNNYEFYYNPAYSERLKRERIEKMQDKGLIYDGLIIGDPQDKPSIEYFEKCIALAENYTKNKINNSDFIVVGDSYEGDLKIPLEQLHVSLAVLINRKIKTSHFIRNNYIECSNLMELVNQEICERNK